MRMKVSSGRPVRSGGTRVRPGHTARGCALPPRRARRGVVRPHVLALVQAGGAGGRMDVLTRERAKPSLPFAGVFQLIDFSLSNLANSGISDVWLSVQFQGAGLGEDVAN